MTALNEACFGILSNSKFLIEVFETNMTNKFRMFQVRLYISHLFIYTKIAVQNGQAAGCVAAQAANPPLLEITRVSQL